MAHQNRYTGHAGVYSVAQHSVLVSDLMGGKMEGLIHDTHETVTADLSEPMKVAMRALGSDAYDRIEVAMATHFRRYFGMHAEMSKECQEADSLARRLEIGTLFSAEGRRAWLKEGITPLHNGAILGIPPVRRMTPEEAERLFLTRFVQLGGTLPPRKDTR